MSGKIDLDSVPLDHWVLVNHKHLGVIQARRDSGMVANGSEFPWDSPAADNWLYDSDIIEFWEFSPLRQFDNASLPKEEVK